MDYCSWEVAASEESPNFSWSRQNAEGLGELAIQGPPFDHDELRNHFFIFASGNEQVNRVLTGSEQIILGLTGLDANSAVGLPYRTTLLKSPSLMSQEHPQECLEFWFFLQVPNF